MKTNDVRREEREKCQAAPRKKRDRERKRAQTTK